MPAFANLPYRKMMSELPYRRFLIALVATVALAAAIRPISAQELTVESTSIENGDVNVPSVVDITITFSKSISVLGLPGLDGGILPIDFDPDAGECAVPPALVAFTPTGCIESWELTGGGSTLELRNVVLAEDQTHTMLILFAVSTEGDVLEVPAVVRFSTGDSLPQGAASGNVSSSDADVTGSLVFLARGDVLGLVTGEDTTAIEPLIGFADGDGNYSVSFAPDGEYFALGAQIDLGLLEGVLGPAQKAVVQGLAVGLHDGTGDRIADPVTISGGGSISGVDINLSSSGDKIREMADIALAPIVGGGAPTARLSFAAGAGLETDGNSQLWSFLFTDLLSGGGWASASFGREAFPPVQVDTVEGASDLLFFLATAMFTNYANSDQAVEWFLQNGGQEFVDENPLAIGAGILMDRALFDILLELVQGGGLPLGPGLEVWEEILKHQHVADALGSIFSKGQTLEAWIVAFAGLDEDFPFYLVAMGDDGSPLLVVGSSTAASNEDKAGAEAEAWASDSYLISLDALELPVASNGTAVGWSYNYYSPSLDSVLTVIASGGPLGSVLLTEVSSPAGHPSTAPMIANWIDSREAIERADEIAAGFLANHTVVTSTAELSKGLQAGNPDLAIWRITYSGVDSEGNPAERIVDLDAATGVFVAIEDEPETPDGFALRQNYPNPFNPETVIPYELENTGEVSLTIYNALGQEIRVLVSGLRASGSHQVSWDARDGFGRLVPSGVYLYRLETTEEVETRRMMLVR